MTLAFKASLPTTQKFVLVALCDSANDQGECYPSVPTLAEKCSMGVRTVQEAIVALEEAGHVRREFRNGRSTVYWVSPRVSAAHGEHHYVYRVTDATTGDFYIGLRTCLGNPASDSYMGSGLELQGRDMSGFTKEVLGEFATRAEAAAAEHAYVDASIGLNGCLNLRRPPVPTPAPAAPRASRTPQQPHPTPAPAAPITVNEPSKEPIQTKTRAVALPDWLPETEWAEFLAHRKAMRSVPFTDAAKNGVIRDLGKLRAKGFDPRELLTTAITRGWRTVFEPRSQVAAKSFRERDLEAARDEASRWTGGRLGSRRQDLDTIDMEPTHGALTAID